MSEGADIAVIGGGLVGKSLAWGFAKAGADVILFDADDDRYHASAGNFGLVWVQGKGLSEPAYAALTLRSANAWPSFADALCESSGIDTQYAMTGGVKFALSDRELEQSRHDLQRRHNQVGLVDNETRIIDRAELLDLMPLLGPDVVGGTFCPHDGHADPLATLSAISTALKRHPDVRMVRSTVSGLAALSGGGFRIETADQTDAANRVVLAAGLGNAHLAPMVGLTAPVRPVRGQIVVTERMDRFLNFACHTIRQTGDGTVLMGDSKEEVGFDTGITRSASGEIVARAVRCFPHLANAHIVRVWGALRVMSPDGLPLYQSSETYPGASLLTCHSGVTLAAAHCGEVANAILQDRLEETYPEFSPSRLRNAA